MLRNWPTIIAIAALTVFLLYLGKLLTVLPIVAIGVIVAIIVAFTTLKNPEYGLLIIIFSMLLSPEIRLAQIPGRDVVVRIDDIILITVFLAWLGYLTINKEWSGIVKTPIDKSLFAVVIVYVLSTAIGIISGNLNPLKSSFYLLKYIEYFILYWTAANILSLKRNTSRYLIAGLLTCIIVTIYAYCLFPYYDRVFAPFDVTQIGQTGESASLAGYLLIIISVITGIIITQEKISIWMPALILLILPTFVRTLSRSTFIALPFSIATLFFFTPAKRKIPFIMAILAISFLFPIVTPKQFNIASDRIKSTFSDRVSSYSLKDTSVNVRLEGSAGARIISWKRIFTEWIPERPLIGHGLTGVGLVDAQIPLLIGEIGLVGFTLFCLLIYSIYKNSLKVFRKSASTIDKGLAVGLMASLSGLMIQCLGVNTFIIVRIMEPFWFLTALVMTAPIEKEIS